MKRWLERALNVRPGDLGRGLPLSACLFFTISAFVVGKVARDTLFLAYFPAVQLPYVDIASGVLVGFVVLGYLRVGQRTSLSHLLVASPLIFGATFVAFWLATHYSHAVWLYPVLYIWVGMFGVLAPTQVWTLANYLLTTREAKRIFGMVGAGGIVGWIFGGYVSKIVARTFGADSLLLAMAALLVVCAGLTAIASKGGRLTVDPEHDPIRGISGAAQRDLHESLRSVFSSPYLLAIAAVICISSFATTMTGWQFKALAKQFSSGTDALAIFFGDFYFYAGALGLLFQFVFTTRLLRRFGIAKMLFVLPLVVLLGSAGLLVWGTVAAALFLKGSDQVLRYSLDRSAIELLYLPLPNRVKVEAKWFIDTVVWRFGDGLAGIVVLIFAGHLGWTPQQISWIAILLIFGWLAAVYVAGKQYVVVLQDSISQHRMDAQQTSTLTLDRSTTDVLTRKILTSDPAEILYALSLFEVEQQRAAHPVLRSLLQHSSPEVRQKAISVLSAVGDKSVRPSMEALLRDPDPGVRTEAMLYLVYHAHVDPLTLLSEIDDCADYSVRSGMAAYFARPGESQNLEVATRILTGMSLESGDEGQRTRRELARILGELPDCFDPLLATLLSDPAQPVALEAIRSVGRLRKVSQTSALLNLLPRPEFSADSAQSLSRLGDGVLDLLGNSLGDSACSLEIRRAIPAILVNIGSPAAARVISENLLERDTALRFQMIVALNKLHRSHPEIAIDTQLVETVLAAEIMGHYRSYQILEAVRVPDEPDDPVLSALHESMQQERERIFRLLGLLHPHLDLHSAYFGLQSNNLTVYDNALEFLDNVLKPQLRSILVPLLDGKVSPQEKASIANTLVRTKVGSREQAVAELVASDDPWLKSCGAYAVGKFLIKSLEPELGRCLEHPDPLLRETARVAKLRLDTTAIES